ncbi:MAG: hypothetical protein ACJAZC_002233 [Cryomorphaceae bacterium]|jgi:hypothetical protein
MENKNHFQTQEVIYQSHEHRDRGSLNIAEQNNFLG